MNILILGNGGREHALAWKAAQSPLARQVFVAPGNAGTAREPNLKNLAVDLTDIASIIDLVQTNAIDFTIIGPEAPLVAGLVDSMQAQGLKVFGPTKGSSQLEGSKAFAKHFLKKYNIPTSAYQVFVDLDQANAYVAKQSFPLVIKADGLAAGKGVIIAQNLVEAQQALAKMLADNQFGEAGSCVVIEEFLTGEEASYIALLDGKTVLPFASSQDHKARDNGDQGPNTGGMGAYSPAPVVTPAIEARILNDIMYPTLAGMAAEGFPYTGFLYAGIMIDAQGAPKVIEYNCRFGDPETQPIMMRLQSDLVQACLNAVDQKLDQTHLEFCPEAALGVVMAAGGYPFQYAKGSVIKGLPKNDNAKPQSLAPTKVFHAGTQFNDDGEVVTHGGRVLCVTALGNNVQEAQQRAYTQVKTIHWHQCYYRDDIGYRAVQRETQTH